MIPDPESQLRRNRRVARDITDAELEKFLVWLAPTQEEAGKKYQEIHRSLTAIFVRRGYAEAEELADETMDRVIRRVARDDSFEGSERLPYFVRVAFHLHLEQQRQKPVTTPISPSGNSAEEQERADRCLGHCLQRLDSSQREMLLQYYRDDQHAKILGRKRLAKEWGLAVETLRIKIHRLRASLRPCLERCVAQAEKV